MQDMGMTDKQFNGFLRFIIDDIKEAREKTKDKEVQELLDRTIEKLQKTLED